MRRADKLTLPPSAKSSLMEQQATKNGQLFFELSTEGGATTHGSILDFTAREGTVGAPPEVLAAFAGLPVLRRLGLGDPWPLFRNLRFFFLLN